MKDILWVDDDVNLLMAVKRKFRKSGWSIDYESSPVSALSLLNINPYKLLIIDFNMPDLNGLEFIKRLRKKDKSIKIILLTGSPENIPEDYTLRDLGVYKIVWKPVDIMNDLSKDIKYLIGGGCISSEDEIPVELKLSYLKSRREDIKRGVALLNAGKWEEVYRIGHNMKGTGKSYGFPELGETGRLIGNAAENRDDKGGRDAFEKLEEYLNLIWDEYFKQ